MVLKPITEAEMVALMRALLHTGLTQREVAAIFTISQGQLSTKLKEHPPTLEQFPYEVWAETGLAVIRESLRGTLIGRVRESLPAPASWEALGRKLRGQA